MTSHLYDFVIVMAIGWRLSMVNDAIGYLHFGGWEKLFL